jgi:hypothetical protein
MPIPALSKSYKQRLQVDKANDESSRIQVRTDHSKHFYVTVVNSLQPVEGSMSNTEATFANNTETSMRPPHSRTSSYQSDIDGGRRRSLLPQPGQAKYGSHQPTATVPKVDSNNTQQPVTGRLRSKLTYQTAATQSAQGKKQEQTGISRSLRQPNAINKSSGSQTTALGRSSSLRKPGASAQAAQTTQSRTHGRTQSTSNTSSLRREVSNTETSTARPRSLVAPSSLRPTGVPVESAPTAPRASARLAGLSRTGSVESRSETTTGGLVTNSISRPDYSEVPQPLRREIPKEEPTKTSRPAFSTLQQHFTPRKTGKAPTSTFLHPAPVSGASTLPPEIINLQSELLQLHLLHAASAEVSQRWHLSARQNLHKKFVEVASLHQAMLQYERAGQEQKNLQALLEWSGGSSSLGLIEYVQILSGPLHELPSLLEPGGRYERLIDEFERWMARVDYIWSTRSDSTIVDGHSRSIEELGDTWKSENMALVRKVTSFARDLEQVREPTSGSSIACIVETCMALLRGLSEELQLLQTLETGVATQEKGWVEARLRAIARDAGSCSIDTDTEIAAWRS